MGDGECILHWEGGELLGTAGWGVSASLEDGLSLPCPLFMILDRPLPH